MPATRTARIVLVLAGALWTTPVPAQTNDAPYGRMTASKVPFRTLATEGGHLHVDVPQRDWQSGSGFGGTVAVLIAKKGDATVLVQRLPLDVPISEADMTDVFESLQVEEMTKGQGSVAGVKHRLVTADGRKYLGLSFTRTGLSGPEQVYAYVFNGGTMLYRLVCIAQADQAPKYARLFGHMAATFKVAAPAAAAP